MPTPQEIANAKEYIKGVEQEVRKTMFGIDDVIRLCIVALFIDKHVLLEGNPGLGKTSLVKAIGETLALEFRRIQFTPDLLPSDILITPSMRETNGQTIFDLGDGPIFTSLLLADEINRATQKTQAALLEAMGERQVTINGKTRRLDNDDESSTGDNKNRDGQSNKPFMVLATQNPVDHEGTYDLPEAQLDRFAFKLIMPNPEQTALRNIMSKTSGALAEMDDSEAHERVAPSAKVELSREIEGQQQTRRKATIERYVMYRSMIRDMVPSPTFQRHVENLFHATNRNQDALYVRNKDEVATLVKKLRYGLGPRAVTDLMLGAKAWTMFFGDTGQIVGHDALAKVLLPVLSHRVKLRHDANEDIKTFVVNLALACIPVGRDVERSYGDRMKTLLTTR